ncbi:MAG: hypothetical protein HDR86_09470 [Bacteroides sp.]|nr:hypothetical protein [Bacteroides sp.]
MESKENVNVGYQFNAVPMNLVACCDLNCRSMLWTLVQLSSYYAAEDGWFFRTNEDLRTQSLLSENLVRATLSTLYNVGVIDVQTVGKGKSKTPNRFKLIVERFADWEKYSLEDCIKHPDLRIETDNYKDKGWQPSYLKSLDIGTVTDTVEIPTSQQIPSQSEDNIDIDNIDNKENILSEGSKQVEVKSNLFEEYKKREDVLMDKLYNVMNWTDFKLIRKQINELISTASSDKIAEKTKKRYKSITEGKIKFLKSNISKEPYNSFYDDFYRECDCGWLGKEVVEKKQIIVQPQDHEEDENAALRATFEQYGWELTEELKPQPKKEEYEAFRPFDDDNLPF